MYGFHPPSPAATLIDNRIEPRRWSYTEGVPDVDSMYPGPDGVGDFQAREWQLGNYDASKAWDKCLALLRVAVRGLVLGRRCDEAAIMQRPCCIPH